MPEPDAILASNLEQAGTQDTNVLGLRIFNQIHMFSQMIHDISYGEHVRLVPTSVFSLFIIQHYPQADSSAASLPQPYPNCPPCSQQ